MRASHLEDGAVVPIVLVNPHDVATRRAELGSPYALLGKGGVAEVPRAPVELQTSGRPRAARSDVGGLMSRV